MSNKISALLSKYSASRKSGYSDRNDQVDLYWESKKASLKSDTYKLNDKKEKAIPKSEMGNL